ncbi:MAG: hypothetical protein ACREP5_13695 [Candidatus Binatia bacterium]
MPRTFPRERETTISLMSIPFAAAKSSLIQLTRREFSCYQNRNLPGV